MKLNDLKSNQRLPVYVKQLGYVSQFDKLYWYEAPVEFTIYEDGRKYNLIAARLVHRRTAIKATYRLESMNATSITSQQ